MRVHHLRLNLLEPSNERLVRSPVLQRQNGPPHLVDYLDPITVPLRPLHQRPLRPQRRPGNERYFMPQVVLPLARQQRVLLRPTDDQAGDDMDDLHSRRANTARAASMISGPRPQVAAHERRRLGNRSAPVMPTTPSAPGSGTPVDSVPAGRSAVSP